MQISQRRRILVLYALFTAMFAAGVLMQLPLPAFNDTEPLSQHVRDNADAGIREWVPYTDGAKEAYLAAGKNVFVFVYAELNPTSAVTLERVDLSMLAKLTGGNEFGTLLYKYDDWSDPIIRSIWQEVGHTKKPFVVRYRPEQLPCALNPFTLKPLVVSYNLPSGVVHRLQPEHCQQ